MKTKSAYFVMLIFVCFYNSLNAQSFKKGTLLVSVSEGSTLANYKTKEHINSTPQLINSDVIIGVRDPLIIEYGVSNKWSIGLSSGNDIFNINPSKYYGFSTSNNIVKTTTSELTFDVNYHVFVNKRLDLSVFASGGIFNIKIAGNDNDFFYKHEASGLIARYGTKARYYFYKRFGVVGMISSYLANASSENIKGNTEAKMYSTHINGLAIEAGLCFKILN
jgi:hypothetical protein